MRVVGIGVGVGGLQQHGFHYRYSVRGGQATRSTQHATSKSRGQQGRRSRMSFEHKGQKGPPGWGCRCTYTRAPDPPCLGPQLHADACLRPRPFRGPKTLHGAQNWPTKAHNCYCVAPSPFGADAWTQPVGTMNDGEMAGLDHGRPGLGTHCLCAVLFAFRAWFRHRGAEPPALGSGLPRVGTRASGAQVGKPSGRLAPAGCRKPRDPRWHSLQIFSWSAVGPPHRVG